MAESSRADGRLEVFVGVNRDSLLSLLFGAGSNPSKQRKERLQFNTKVFDILQTYTHLSGDVDAFLLRQFVMYLQTQLHYGVEDDKQYEQAIKRNIDTMMSLCNITLP